MGQYLHHYETENAFSAAYNGSDYHEPWVSFTDELGTEGEEHVDYNKRPTYMVTLATSMGDTDHCSVCPYFVTGNTVTIQLQDIVDWIDLNGNDEEGTLMPTLTGASACYAAFGPAYNEGKPWMDDSSKYNPSTVFYNYDTFWENNEGIDLKTATGTVTVNFGQGWVDAMKNTTGYAQEKISTIQVYLHFVY